MNSSSSSPGRPAHTVGPAGRAAEVAAGRHDAARHRIARHVAQLEFAGQHMMRGFMHVLRVIIHRVQGDARRVIQRSAFEIEANNRKAWINRPNASSSIGCASFEPVGPPTRFRAWRRRRSYSMRRRERGSGGCRRHRGGSSVPTLSRPRVLSAAEGLMAKARQRAPAQLPQGLARGRRTMAAMVTLEVMEVQVVSRAVRRTSARSCESHREGPLLHSTARSARPSMHMI